MLVLRHGVGEAQPQQRAIGVVQVPGDAPARIVLPAGSAAVGVASVGDHGGERRTDAAVAVPTAPVSVTAVLAGVGLIVAGTTVGYVISTSTKVDPYRVGDPITIFGLLIVFAAALERLLEPFTQRLPGRRARAAYEQAVARLANGDPTTTMSDIAGAWARVQRARTDRVIITWGLATSAATVACAGTGFFLLRALADEPNWDGVSRWIDALITGLIVGSGTKPVHDLIAWLQTAKTAAEDRA